MHLILLFEATILGITTLLAILLSKACLIAANLMYNTVANRWNYTNEKIHSCPLKKNCGVYIQYTIGLASSI